MRRLTIDMSHQQQSPEALAALQSKTITGNGGADQAWQALKFVLDERISAGLSGQVSAHSITEILDEELAAAQDGRI